MTNKNLLFLAVASLATASLSAETMFSHRTLDNVSEIINDGNPYKANPVHLAPHCEQEYAALQNKVQTLKAKLHTQRHDFDRTEDLDVRQAAQCAIKKTQHQLTQAVENMRQFETEKGLQVSSPYSDR